LTARKIKFDEIAYQVPALTEEETWDDHEDNDVRRPQDDDPELMRPLLLAKVDHPP
jgi:hypothetical protein